LCFARIKNQSSSALVIWFETPARPVTARNINFFPSSNHKELLRVDILVREPYNSSIHRMATLEGSFEQFRELVLRDAKLQERLRETVHEDVFIERVVQLGAERGCHFSANAVREAMRANRRAWLERRI
jgi:hypothetical protein